VSGIRSEVDCSRIESTLSTRSLPSNDESSKYRLPALPNFLELVVRKIKDCVSRNLLSFGCLRNSQRSSCLSEPAITGRHASHTAPLTEDITLAQKINVRARPLAIISNAFG